MAGFCYNSALLSPLLPLSPSPLLSPSSSLPSTCLQHFSFCFLPPCILYSLPFLLPLLPLPHFSSSSSSSNINYKDFICSELQFNQLKPTKLSNWFLFRVDIEMWRLYKKLRRVVSPSAHLASLFLFIYLLFFRKVWRVVCPSFCFFFW